MWLLVKDHLELLEAKLEVVTVKPDYYEHVSPVDQLVGLGVLADVDGESSVFRWPYVQLADVPTKHCRGRKVNQR